MRFFRKLAKFMMFVAIIGVLIYFGIYLKKQYLKENQAIFLQQKNILKDLY